MTEIFCVAEQGEWPIESGDPRLAPLPGRDPSSPCFPSWKVARGGSEWRDQEGRTPQSQAQRGGGSGGREISLLPSPLALSSRAGLGQTPGSCLKDP